MGSWTTYRSRNKTEVRQPTSGGFFTENPQQKLMPAVSGDVTLDVRQFIDRRRSNVIVDVALLITVLATSRFVAALIGASTEGEVAFNCLRQVHAARPLDYCMVNRHSSRGSPGRGPRRWRYKTCRQLIFKIRRSGALAMSNDYYLMLQTSIICLLLFLVGMTAMVQHPIWFQ
jgi:hypothetical protein